MPARAEHGAPAPLGATWDGGGVNFALFSAHASKVELCLFDGAEGAERERIALPGRTRDIWHVRIEGLGPGQHYGYRVHGPFAPKRGHRFNPHKLLLDPYARAVSGTPRWGSTSYDSLEGDPAGGVVVDDRNNAPLMPRAVVVDPTFDWGTDARPATPWSDTVIYETHVAGMTRLHPDVEPALRGTFQGFAHPRVIAHLKSLGVTAVELLPVHAFVDDPFLVRNGLKNYWGYSTMAYFAPEPRYLGGSGPEAFKSMVRDLHAAGLEVILDVVYNHTAEGNHLGPVLSLRGIDNASYYRLDPADPTRYLNYTGCGNTLDMSHPQVRALVLDSLRYWVEHMHVDGFRFDLATTVARGHVHFEPFGEFFKSVSTDPILRDVKLIAEPWDLGPEGYRLGGFPPGWAEWNDRYRDTVRAFWLQSRHAMPEFARRVHGSGDLFDHPGRSPWASVNYAASHDGFTVRDAVSYERRHNAANNEGNRDGHADNHSNNHGVEGPTDDPAVAELRARQVRNLLATVFLSQGTPMLLGGDEMGRTQDGNNNAYCQDNTTSWLDWSKLHQERELVEFVGRLARLRARHPLLRRRHFVHGDDQVPVTGYKDIEWLRPTGGAMTERDWLDSAMRCLGVLLAGPAPAFPGREEVLLVVFNGGRDGVRFSLPRGDGFDLAFRGWRCVLSTGATAPVGDGQAAVEARSVNVFEPVPHGGAR